jgi:hypothetical protein
MVYVCTLTRDSINANTVFDLVALLKESYDATFASVVGIYSPIKRRNCKGCNGYRSIAYYVYRFRYDVS